MKLGVEVLLGILWFLDPQKIVKINYRFHKGGINGDPKVFNFFRCLNSSVLFSAPAFAGKGKRICVI